MIRAYYERRVALVSLCLFAFLAGLVDSVAGGGGLIQLPALLWLLPADQSAALVDVLGTNKAAAIFGTAMAVTQYAPRVRIAWRSILPSAIAAFITAALGAAAVSRVSTTYLEPVIFVLLVGVAIYTFRQPSLGQLHAPRLGPRGELAAGLAIGAGLGFYDGFFGPGMGSFLMFAFIGWLGFDFLNATAGAKVVNLATNLAALLLFTAGGHVLYRIALPMAACQIAGAFTGTRIALAGGNRFVRALFLIVATALIVRFGWDALAP
jgi:uncharacterized membrane protein YfcA